MIASGLQVLAVTTPVPAVALTCAEGGACAVGERGPGGGIIYYVSATNFSSPGSSCNTACKYLEVAPSTWRSNGTTVADDLAFPWSDNITVSTTQNSSTAGAERGLADERYNWKIGQGLYNTSVMKVAGATSTPQAAVLAYAGNVTAGQWFIPSMNELNELCKYTRGQATGVLTEACVTGSGTFKTTANAGTDLGGFVANFYWSSSEGSAANVAWGQYIKLTDVTRYSFGKKNGAYIRPVRAVAAPPVSPTTTVLSTNPSAVYGASNTLTATVSANSATGTMDFKYGANSITGCNAAIVTAGVATCTTWKPMYGSYSITAEYSGSGSLATSVSDAVSFSVTAAPLSITASSPTVDYGASTPTVTASYSGLVNSEAPSVVTGLSCSTTYTSTSQVGSLPTTTCSGGVASNYAISYTSGAVTINKAAPTFNAWAAVLKTFGNSNFSITAPIPSTPGLFSYSSATPSVISLSGSTATVAGAGTSIITATFAPTDTTNFISGGTATATITVDKNTPVFTWSGVTKTYGDSSFSLTAPTKSTPGTFSYSSATPSVVSLSGEVATVVGFGTSVITATFTPTNTTNYYSGGTTSMTATVGKGIPAFSWSDTSKIFGDNAFTLTPPTSTVLGSFTFVSATPSVISISRNTATVAGSGSSVITATFTPADSSQYVSDGTITMTVSVQQGSQTIPVVISSTTGEYGTDLALTTTGGSGSGSISFVVDSGPCTVLGSTLTPTGGGSCMVTATKSAGGDYLAANSLSTSISITKATPALSNFNNVLRVFGASHFDLIAPTSSTPGNWTYSSATPSVVSLSGIAATVAGYGTSVITATFSPSANTNYYSGETITMTVTVDKATLIITASSHTVAYGDAIPTITPLYSGFVNNENSNVVAGTTCSTTYTTTTAVGINGSTCIGATASNYSFTYTGGVITIIRSEQTTALTITSISVTYGSTLSLTTDGGSGLGVKSFTVDSGPCDVSSSILSATAAGTCMVTATKAANGNFLLSSSASTAITVNPKGLTISGLSGVNKEFDGGLIGSVIGTPSLVGVINSDNVLLGGRPTFTYASSNVANGITVTASSYTLTGTNAENYLLTQPTVTANITAKGIRVVSNDVTVAFGAPVTGSITAIGIVLPDAISAASYTYTPPGTSAVPTEVGVYTVAPSNAIFGTGSIANYLITYETATVTILAKYTVTYNGNGGVVASAGITTVDFVVGGIALTLPAATRVGFSFLGWFTTETGSTQVSGDYTPTATTTLWAHWIQKSLIGIGSSPKIGTITTLANVSNTYSATSRGGSVAVTYVANALAASTVIDIYQMNDSSRASSLISSDNTYVLSLVIAWLTPTGTVPVLSTSNALTMLITDSAIMKGAKVYSLVGNTSTLLGTATVDGSVSVKITEDPEVYIAITKPDAPTGVSATSGGNASTTVSWTAPSEGGSAITLYTVISNAGQSCTSVTTSCSITGLTNGTPYTFTVTATNTIGVSDASLTSTAATPAAPVANVSSSGAVDNSAASAAAQAKMEADKKAAEFKAATEKKAAEETEVAALKAAAELADSQAKVAAELKAATDKGAAELRIAEELRQAGLKAERELKLAAEKKAAEDAAVAAKAAKPAVTLYSVSSTFKLNAYNSAYLQKYVKSLKSDASVTCIGYSYSKNTTLKKANALAKSQATAVCALMKNTNKTLKTSVVVYPSSKAPKAALGAKWVGVSYRIDGFKIK